MTKVSFKLVGYNIDTLININKDSITMLDIFSYLMENGMLMTEISQIMFVNNGKNITNDVLTLFNGTDEYPLIIHMFTNKVEIKNEIIKHIFNNDNNDVPPYEEINSNDNRNNIKIIELFADKDFVYLLNICHNKPELINKVSSYLTNGNITNFEIKEINNFNYENEFIKLVELLNSINKQFDENELKSIIQHFEGNLNLSLRYILNK
jgi:hypothetical protein